MPAARSSRPGLPRGESTAILEYLEATRPSSPLLPADVRLRAVVSMHVKLCDLEFAGLSRAILIPKRFLPKERWMADKMEEAKRRIQKHLDILETQIQGREYLVDGRFSLAEVCYAPFLQFLPLMEVTPGPSTASWTARVLERPSVRDTKPPK
ncbi:MAG TPA: glutathione S-transferase family protein [Candidatus Polarisedimenticolia bacterium]|nr:glutathione S-transferase family protein [Candidatus Polarisedimenticolia bacterium]